MSGFNSEEFQLVEEAEFFAPTTTDAISQLLAEHGALRTKIEMLAEHIAGDLNGVVGYFLDGNTTDRRSSYGNLADLFKLSGAVKALDAEFWSKTLNLTDVLNYMPQARRSAWHKQITGLSSFSCRLIRLA